MPKLFSSIFPDTDRYIITRNGAVFDAENGIVKPTFLRNGYQCVRIGHTNYYIHRLLAEAFIPNPEHKSEINHKDGRKLNNSLSNLEWCSYSENISHAYNTGLRAHRSTQVKCVEKNLEFDSIQEAASYFHIRVFGIYACLEGARNTCHGYHWEKIGNKPKKIIKNI